MRFQWSGSTWTTTADDAPSVPVSVTTVGEGATLQRTYAGAVRYVYRHEKRLFGMAWTDVGTNAPEVYIRAMIAAGGTVEIAYHQGTYNTYPVPGSLTCDETGYYVYNITAQFAEA